MVKPRLLFPIYVEIAILPLSSMEMDEDWNTPVDVVDEVIDDPLTPRVRVKAQVMFSGHDDLTPTAGGDDESGGGYLIISSKTQRLHQFKTNDFVTKIFQRKGPCLNVRHRITKVTPKAQRGSFDLWKLTFEKDARGQV